MCLELLSYQEFQLDLPKGTRFQRKIPLNSEVEKFDLVLILLKGCAAAIKTMLVR
jgi:hypothetical protein